MHFSPLYQGKDGDQSGSMIFLTHGGGPLPLLGDPRHQQLVEFLRWIPSTLIVPSAIIVVSAHWEEGLPTLSGGSAPELFFDYYGFPEESYAITYPAPGARQLAEDIQQLLREEGLAANLDDQRGFDHGMFISLKIMYPKADIPCIQLSLLDNLDAKEHINMGRLLRRLNRENLLIIGSGSSFHNLRAFREPPTGPSRQANEDFEGWLTTTLSANDIGEEQRQQLLQQWQEAPSARFCHPRQEHLLPLHVCYGIAGRPASRIYSMEVMDKRVSAYIW